MVFKGYNYDAKWCLASTEVYPHTCSGHKFFKQLQVPYCHSTTQCYSNLECNAMYIPMVFFHKSLLFFPPPDKSVTVPSLHFLSIYFSACFSLAFSTSRLSWKLLLSIISNFLLPWVFFVLCKVCLCASLRTPP